MKEKPFDEKFEPPKTTSKKPRFDTDDESIRDSSDEEMFPEVGFAPCIRNLPNDYEENSDRKKTGTNIRYTFQILFELSEKKIHAESTQKLLTNSDIRVLKKHTSSQFNKNKSGSIEHKFQKFGGTKALVRGETATELKTQSGDKLAKDLLTELISFGLIETFKQDDNNISKRDKLEKLNKSLENERKKKKSNDKKIKELKKEIISNSGKGKLYYMITHKGENALEKIQKQSKGDPLYFLKKFLTDE